MTASVHHRRLFGLAIEYILASAVLAGGLHLAFLTFKYGYFPQPFFYDPDDTWRDWFSTAIWAHESGAYDSWLSIYPPLSFAILKFVGLPQCYEYAPLTTVRDCDWVGVIVMHSIYVLNIFLTARLFMKADRKTALARSFAISAGMPMLFGLERGNIVLLCFTFVLLGFGPILKSARLRWLFAAMAINLKVYLIAALLPMLIRRKWLWVEATLLLVVVVWTVSYLIYGSGSPFEVYSNIVNWATNSTPGNVLAIWYPNTFQPLEYVLGESSAPISMLIDSRVINAALILMPLTTHLAQGAILFAAAIAWLRPEVVPTYRLVFFGVELAMVTSETSTYTQPIMFLFVMMEPWKGWGRPIALITCYVLCIPGDVLISGTTNTVAYSFISGHFVIAQYGVALGMLFRPFLFMIPAYALSAVTVWDVLHDVRRQGWGERWRFRFDLPVLPRVNRPKKPREA